MMLRKFFLTLLGIIGIPCNSFAYTSLLTSTSFDGVNADVNTMCLGIIGIFMTIFAIGMIVRGLMGGR